MGMNLDQAHKSAFPFVGSCWQKRGQRINPAINSATNINNKNLLLIGYLDS